MLKYTSFLFVLSFVLAAPATIRDGAFADDVPAVEEGQPATEEEAEKPLDELPGLRRLSREDDIWIDTKRKLVVVDGKVCLRRGQLEMLACPKGTKEHEAIISVNSKASYVHAALLAVGAVTGNTVQFDPEYVPATGTQVDVWILWIDKDGNKRKVRGQDWVRRIDSGMQMTYPWVFAGSGFWKDPATGMEHYMGDGGDLICVSNFPTATLDLPVRSSKDNENLIYEAFTDRIPSRGTHVRVVLIPRPDKKPMQEDSKEKSESEPSEKESANAQAESSP